VTRSVYPDLLPAAESARAGQRLRAARLSRGLSQRQVGEKSGLSSAYVSDIERGTRRVRAAHLPVLAEVVRITPEGLTALPSPERGRLSARSHRDIPATCPCDWRLVFEDRRPAGWELDRPKVACPHHKSGGAR
jgi:transcriptional regulator with XRE-family HTH domain